jgi:hypothetical protein
VSYEAIDLAALLALPAVAAAIYRFRPDTAARVSVIALIGLAAGLAVLPVDRQIGGGGLVLAVSGFGKGALWLSMLGVAIAVLAVNQRPGADGAIAWSAQLAATLLVAARSPVLMLAVVMVIAVVLPRLEPGVELGLGWSRCLIAGAALVTAALMSSIAAPPRFSDHTTAVLLVLGFAIMLGAMPFGVGLRQWLIHAPARLAILATGCLVPALATTMVNALADFSQVHLATSAGTLIAAFGALTLILGSMAQLGASGWRDLAADGVMADLGLVMVGIGALDINGLQGASLALLVMVLARPFLYLLEEMAMSGPWAWMGAGAALFAACGLPPTVGFAARLLLLGSAFHIHPVLAAAVVAGIAVEIFASARLLLRIGVPLAGPEPRTGLAPLAIVVAGLVVAGGLVPAGVLTYIWNLG